MNRLPPSLRESERYVKFRVRSGGVAEIGDVVDAVWESALDYLGTRGAGEADLWVIGNQFDEEAQTGVLKVRTSKLDDLRAALSTVRTIGGEKGFFQVTEVSGSIRNLK